MDTIDGYYFVCKLCGEHHEVPEEVAPYWDNQTQRNVLVGEVSLPCPQKSGTAQYSYGDFQAYRLRAEQQEDAFACQDPDCSRYYSPWRCYFFAKVGEYPDFGVPSKKPQCRHESETMYMFLTWKDGMLLWACPVKGCGKAEPFKP